MSGGANSEAGPVGTRKGANASEDQPCNETAALPIRVPKCQVANYKFATPESRRTRWRRSAAVPLKTAGSGAHWQQSTPKTFLWGILRSGLSTTVVVVPVGPRRRRRRRRLLRLPLVWPGRRFRVYYVVGDHWEYCCAAFALPCGSSVDQYYASPLDHHGHGICAVCI